MNTEKKARKTVAKSHQQEEHIEQNLLIRSQAEIKQTSSQKIELEARKLMVEQQQETEHLKATMLSRSKAEIDERK
ncbi:hypothetical protein [Hyella patelloides]|nr:hypothetical protein [Hyella patelloides]